LSVRAAFSQVNNDAAELIKKKSAKVVILTTLAVTFLNPHAYIDTVMIIGSVGGQYSGEAKVFFLIGAILGSVVWFSCLATGAAKLSSQLSKPKVKRIIDLAIAAIMWFIAWSLFTTWLAR
jgi:L-lysine exporter family protein LysE/ArgO